ncbi:cell division protein FtsA [Brassicibacter mesophilus]|uniref:cell division protein FtsA n=1 Tax=Brassicibacter mesophilus TaxID=745119 RepID=UPI003D1A7D9E
MGPDNMINTNTDDLIFSLDIGTRTVIGVVGTYQNNKFKIIASEILEHQKRTMYDGQIHDINGVTEIVKEIKENLENKLNLKLSKVAIAAAGRALRTYRARIDREIDITTEINHRMIESLELEAIQHAQDTLDKSISKDETRYYCVGYTVINYYLDDNFIENLEWHRGNKIGIDVLATFLPHTVIDSLYTVMSRAGLEVVNLTLEPIAAINVAIKKNLRLLNLALVDIGAGTSDIAITKGGTIVAYAMASIAGDEITEKIATTYLLDYDEAERLKVKLTSDNTHKFFDIVGIEHELTTDQILDNIDEAIKMLAKEIADKILEYNEKAPSAIFLIGGGSQIPRISEYISDYLEMPKERVVVKDTEIIENVLDIPEQIRGPHAITPIGIAITAANKKYKDFIDVIVNDQNVSIFNSNQVKISDVLVLIGYNPRKLIPKRGEALNYYINGIKKKVLGEVGESAKVYVNNHLANLEQIINDGDNIKIIDATKGKDAKIDLYSCVNIGQKIICNDKEVSLISNIRINGNQVKDNIHINENDFIEFDKIDNLEQLLSYLKLAPSEYTVLKEGKTIDYNYLLKDGDVLTTNLKSVSIDDHDNSAGENITLFINGKEVNINHNKESFIFVDVFEYIDFDLSKPQGSLTLKVNGERAEYIQDIKDGDNIEIYWEK